MLHKIFRYGWLIVFLSVFVMAQNTITPTGAIVDSDAQAWAFGSYSWTLYNPSGGGQAHYKDGTPVPHNLGGSLDSTGSFQAGQTLPNNNQILPTGTQANLTVCSLTSAPNNCQTFRFAITSDSPTIGTRLSTMVSPPRVQGAVLTYNYNTTEIENPVQGNGYINTSQATPSQWIYQNGTWVEFSSGAGGTPGGVDQDVQLNHPLGTFGADTGVFTENTTTHVAKVTNGTLDVSGTDVFPNHNISIIRTGPNVPSASGDDAQGFMTMALDRGGYIKDIGNMPGLPNDGSGGWTTGHGLQMSMTAAAYGIANLFEGTLIKYGIGDSRDMARGIVTPGGCQDSSGECSIFASWGGGQPNEFQGTVVTAGQNPVFSGGPLVNGGLVEDISKTVISGNMTAVSTTWGSSSPIGVQSLPVSATVTPSTWIGTLTSYIAPSATLGIPFTQAFTASTVSGTQPSSGTAFVISPNLWESCPIVGSGQISCAQPHGIDSMIFVGGTQGCLSTDLEAARSPSFTNHTDPIVLGGIDSSHLALAFITTQGLEPFPILGSMLSVGTSPFHVYQCAKVMSLQTDGVTEIMDQTPVAWSNGDSVVAPNPTSYGFSGILTTVSELSPNNPSRGDQDVIATCGGMGCGNEHVPFLAQNNNHESDYVGTGLVPYVVNQNKGPISGWMIYDDPLPSTAANALPCGTNPPVFLCDKNTLNHTSDFIFFGERSYSLDKISFLRSLGAAAEWLYAGTIADQEQFVSEPNVLGLYDGFKAYSQFTLNQGAGWSSASYGFTGGIQDANGTQDVMMRSYGFRQSGNNVGGIIDVAGFDADGQSATQPHAWVFQANRNFSFGRINTFGANTASSPFVCTDSNGDLSTTATSSTCTTGERGTSTLVAGTVTVTSSTIGTTSVVQLTNCGVNASTIIGTLSVGTRVSNTSFVINSLTATNTTATGDVSSVCWFIPR